ncbi:MAG: ABC transporter permease subunit [Bacteroidota bacterium]
MNLFALRGKLAKSHRLILGLVGFVLLVLIWWGLAELKSVQKPIIEGYNTQLPSSINADEATQALRDSLILADSLAFANATEFEKIYPSIPPPHHVVQSFPSLIQKDGLFANTLQSIWLNVRGYFWAIIISLLFGFIIGLIPMFRGLFAGQVDALRFLPLTALVGLFTAWFGIDDGMKIAFLAFGIIIFLLPVVVQRIDEVKDVYLKTVFTLGATDWQTIKTVYFPSVMSRLMDDIRVITAISWTYIIIAELLNRQGGIGSLIYIKARQGQMEKVFAMLIVIVLIGFLQDKLFAFFDRKLFPHKYRKTHVAGIVESQYGIMVILILVALALILTALFSGLASSMNLMMIIATIAGILMIFYGEFKLFNADKES